MPDEAFEGLWKRKGGPELVAMHAIFEGTTLKSDEVRGILGLTMEQLRGACEAAGLMGLVEHGDERITFPAFPADSAQRGRLDWCLEEHGEEFGRLVDRIRTRLLVRFLESSPGQAGG